MESGIIGENRVESGASLIMELISGRCRRKPSLDALFSHGMYQLSERSTGESR